MSRQIPDNVVASIREHSHGQHGVDCLELSEIGRRNTRTAVRSVYWVPAKDERGPTFRCSRCPAGEDLYYVDLGALAPTRGVLPLIRRHFAEAHSLSELPLAEIAFEGNTGPGRKAVWLPMTEANGAGIVCKLCPEGGSRTFLTDPPHGDARRHRYLRLQYPELLRGPQHRGPRELADYMDAWDRGLVDTGATTDTVRNALEREREIDLSKEPSLLERALGRLMLDGVAAGKNISTLIRGLRKLAWDNPNALAILLGRTVPQLAEYESIQSAEDFVASTETVLQISVPRDIRVSERTLWRIWGGVKGSGAAGAGGS